MPVGVEVEVADGVATIVAYRVPEWVAREAGLLDVAPDPVPTEDQAPVDDTENVASGTAIPGVGVESAPGATVEISSDGGGDAPPPFDAGGVLPADPGINATGEAIEVPEKLPKKDLVTAKKAERP